MLPWTEKYLPKSLKDVRGQNTPLGKLSSFVKEFPGTGKKACLLYGPPGCGKTASVYALAEELGKELIEINASDFRDKTRIEAMLGPAIAQQSLFFKGKIILVDEVDGMSGSRDRGGLSALAKLVKTTTFPIVFTANDPWDAKFSGIRRESEIIKFNTLSYRTVMSVLADICKKENVVADEDALSLLAHHVGGDLRGGIIDLQILTAGGRQLRKEYIDDLSDRRQVESMVNALMRIFKTKDPLIAREALDVVNEDVDQIFFWIDENLPKEYTKRKDLWRAYDAISNADIFRRRIRRWQHWRFLVYIYDLLSVGVALAKDERYKGFNKYVKTSRILKMWQANNRNRMRKAIAEKIALKTHCSKRIAFKEIPFYLVIFKNDKDMGARVSDYLGLDKEEIAFLSK